ncbi:MAG TPA: transcription elongation factor GreA [Candidatus Saccharimonadales bacterium]|nr:transcription elongation factor GreA [Candidatus Saccharimonadales bacterium]
MQNIRFTQNGYDQLKKEFANLTASRPDAVANLKRAREMGDLSENGFYKESRAKLSSIDRRLRIISHTLKNAVIIQSAQYGWVGINTHVVLSSGGKELSFVIVGDLEADPKARKISLLSPLGKALEGKRVGDTVHITTPKGTATFTIVSIG